MKFLLPVLLVGIGLDIAACGVSVEAPYLLNDLKVVSVVAEPPDIMVGHKTHLTALIAAPKNPGGPLTTGWSICQERGDSATNPTCSDPLVLPQGAPQRRFAGIYTIEADLTADSAWVEGVPAAILQAGFWVYTTVSVDAPGAVTAKARKRAVIIGAGVAPNRNPILRKVDVWLGGTHIGVNGSVDPGATLELVPDIDASAFDAYTVLANDGTFIPRLEDADITWYVTTGSLSTPLSRGTRSILWSLPRSARGSRQQFVAVLRDSRGGQAAWAGEVGVR